MNMRLMKAVMLLGCGLAVASDAQAQTPQSQPVQTRFATNLAENHDRGVFGRVAAGGGYASRWNNQLGLNGATVGQGAAFNWQLALGWLPATQLAVHVTQWGNLGGNTGAFGFGPGVTYWLGPDSPWYLSASLGPVAVDEVFDQWAVGGEAEIGLLAWIADHAQLGVTFFVGGDALDLDGDTRRLDSWRTGLRATASFE